MAKQPTFQDVGNVAVSGERHVGTYDVTPLARSAQEIAQAGVRFGHAIEGIGSAVDEVGQRRDQTQYVNALARGLTRGIDLRSQLRSNSDHDAIEPLWNDGSGKIVDDEAAGIDNERLRDRFRAVIGQHFATQHASIAEQAFRGRSDAAAAAIDTDRQHLVNTTDADGDLLHNAKIEVHNALIDTAERNGYLGHEAALQEKRRSANDIAVAKYRQMGRSDPDRAIGELAEPNNPNPIAQFLPAETREGLIAQARANQQAQRLDADRALRLKAQRVQRVSDEAENATLKDLLGENPTVTATGIANSDTLTPAARQRMSGVAARALQPEPLATVSNATAVDLLDRIRRPDGDPEKIGDMAPIIEAYNVGGLDKRDLAFVAKQLDETRAPDGDLMARRKQALMRSVEPLIDPGGADPAGPGLADATGKSRLYELERDIDHRIDRYRQERNDSHDLFDPSKPDYVGTPQTLLPYFHGSLLHLIADTEPTAGENSTRSETLNSSSATDMSPGSSKTAQNKSSERSEAEAARSAAAERLIHSTFHNKEGALTDSIPYLTLSLLGMAPGPGTAAFAVRTAAQLAKLYRTFGRADPQKIEPIAEKPEAPPPDSLKDINITATMPHASGEPIPPREADDQTKPSKERDQNSPPQEGEIRAHSLSTLEKIRQELHDRAHTLLRELDPTNPSLPSEPESVPSLDDIKRLNDEIAKRKSNWKGSYPLERHHTLPKEFKEYFETSGLNLDHYVVYLPADKHRLLPDGLHTGPNNWNTFWREFIDANRRPNVDRIHGHLYLRLNGMSRWQP